MIYALSYDRCQCPNKAAVAQKVHLDLCTRVHGSASDKAVLMTCLRAVDRCTFAFAYTRHDILAATWTHDLDHGDAARNACILQVPDFFWVCSIAVHAQDLTSAGASNMTTLLTC